MTPTPQLRFVEREVPVSNHKGFGLTVRTLRILQQWWTSSFQEPPNGGEWRDVPVEKE